MDQFDHKTKFIGKYIPVRYSFVTQNIFENLEVST